MFWPVPPHSEEWPIHCATAHIPDVPFDATAPWSYGQIVAAVAETGRSHRRRVAAFLIAATAHANDLVLYTRNPDDFSGLYDLVRIVGIRRKDVTH
jgi:hypothetical protein